MLLVFLQDEGQPQVLYGQYSTKKLVERHGLVVVVGTQPVTSSWSLSQYRCYQMMRLPTLHARHDHLSVCNTNTMPTHNHSLSLVPPPSTINATITLCMFTEQTSYDSLNIDNCTSFCRAALKHFCNLTLR